MLTSASVRGVIHNHRTVHRKHGAIVTAQEVKDEQNNKQSNGAGLRHQCISEGGGTIVGEEVRIASGENTDVEVPIGNDRPPVVITINLSSNGDIRLVTDTETFSILDSGEYTVG